MGSTCETSCYGPAKNPWDLTRSPRRLLRRGGRRGSGRGGVVRHRLGHRRLHPPARRPLRRHRHEAHLRLRVPVRPGRLRLLPGSARPHRPLRRRLRGGAGAPPWAGSPGRHQSGAPHRGTALRPHRRRAGQAHRPARRVLRRRAGAGGGRRRPGRRRGAPGAGGGGGGGVLPAPAGLRGARLLHPGLRRGLLQPGPVRRGEIRLAGGGLRQSGGAVPQNPHRGLRPGGEEADSSGHLRPLRGLLRLLLQKGPPGQGQAEGRLRRGLPEVRPAPHPGGPTTAPRLGGRAWPTR